MVEVPAGLFVILAGGFALWASYDEDTFRRWVKSKLRKGWTLARERAGGMFAGVFFILIGALILAVGVMKLLA